MLEAMTNTPEATLTSARHELRRRLRRARHPGETHADLVRREVDAIRWARDLSGARLAALLGVTAPVLHRYRTGERRSAQTAQALRALGCSTCGCGAVDCSGCGDGAG